MLLQSIKAALLAGDEILNIYSTQFEVEYKQDKSPVTLADKNASDIIVHELSIFGIPVLSEEGEHDDYSIRKNWKQCWIVDPLDGTKEFVKKNGEFTVNIALVENQKPVLGIIYSPVSNNLYFAKEQFGAYKIEGSLLLNLINTKSNFQLEDLLAIAQKLPIKRRRTNYVVVASRSHLSSELYNHIENLKIKFQPRVVDTINTGSSIKMCLIAEGVADEYPRFGPTMEWDTAAGHAILLESGCELIDEGTNKQMLYNRENLLNASFVAKRNQY